MASKDTAEATSGIDRNSGQAIHDPWTTYYRERLAGNSEDPPTYHENEPSISDTVQQLSEAARADGDDLPILEYPQSRGVDLSHYHERTGSIYVRQDIVKNYFDAISTKKDEIVAQLIQGNLVTTETTNNDGRTPLLAAIEAGHIRTVQQLMDFDADVNAYGVTGIISMRKYGKKPVKIQRTPLQFAAEKGYLTMVKLLMETYNADDSLIAPDGELALRLAATNGHKEIVQYLPSRRGGGWRRWKTKHVKAMERAKKACHGIYWFFRILVFEIPKCLVWSMPKHMIVLPIVHGVKWMYAHRAELPEKIKWWFKERVWKVIKCFVKDLWEFIKEIPEGTKRFVIWIWRAIKATPRAVKIAALWVWGGIKRIGNVIGTIFSRLFSFIHTVLSAIASFFRGLTLRDVWNGFCAFVHAIFVDGPKKLWEWICKFGDVTYRIMDTLFGCMGKIMWWLVRGLIELVIYVPKKLWEILASCGSSASSGCKEVLIWINPKR
ncbi:ankyrin [Zopfia rhizophila CBS 207.26]|uniref:Ankyrin n=1 Tax=Zopfia rhizophila CBS 207.26 TaxID=1314779 RepID=A0A6A6DY76_9PEZI|nr:ankyrin [Zopfia rhizophila CBS 207.26]